MSSETSLSVCRQLSSPRSSCGQPSVCVCVLIPSSSHEDSSLSRTTCVTSFYLNHLGKGSSPSTVTSECWGGALVHGFQGGVHNSSLTPCVVFREVKLKVLVAHPCLTLCDPVDCSPPGSSVHGILQASILEWVAISFSRGSSQPRDRTQISHIAGEFFTI